MGLRRALVAVVAVLGTLAVLLPTPTASALVLPVPTTPPTVTGTPAYREVLVAEPGVWSPAAASYSFQWLRDGEPIADATAARYRLDLDDLGARISVSVTAVEATTGLPGTAVSAPVGPVARADFRRVRKPEVRGEWRWTRTLTAGRGEVAPRPDERRYRWLRDGEPIGGARSASYTPGVEDVGHRVSVRMTVKREGYRTTVVETRPRLVDHLVPVRRVVTYHVETRGAVSADLAEFRRQAQETYDDPRGWRAAGVQFRPVRSGGDFTLVLAVAGAVPGFSSGCSATWSCRVGRYVIINQTRWQTASPAWNAAGRARRDYRHMVVNHETGHWLGHGHLGCSGTGPAPVMMQQSKGRGGCSFNPWPLPFERWFRR